MTMSYTRGNGESTQLECLLNLTPYPQNGYDASPCLPPDVSKEPQKQYANSP